MLQIPRTSDTPFVRTDFSDERVWQELTAAVGRETEEGFRASISTVNDVGFSGASVRDLARSAAGAAAHRLLLVADETTIRQDEWPILCIDLLSPERSIRVVPGALWEIENNLTLGNMDFDDFVHAAGSDEIFRGFT
ncbi:MAG TPA: hypothetical protein VGH15_14745 [Caulobacteraceae bacterium]|jgi:hypothetical protein